MANYFTTLGAIFILTCGFQLASSGAINKAEEQNVICYFGSWATYRTGIATFDVSNIDTSLCTHVVYAYTGLDNNEIISLDPYNDFEENYGKGTMKKFIDHITSNGIKSLLGVGGWNEGSVKYSEMVSTAEGRETFADSAVTFIQDHGFNGLQLDWQYPTQRGGSADDRENFVLLLETLSEKFKPLDLILSIGVGAAPSIATPAYDFGEIAKHADLIILLSFDYHTYTDQVTAISAPLRDEYVELSIEYSVNQWLDGGAPSNKLIVGIPLYGRTSHLASPSNHALGERVTGPGTPGQFTQEGGILAYFEYCTESSWEVVSSDDPIYVYAHYDSEWINYDDPTTIAEKGQFVLDNNLGGIMVFSLESEDFGGNCDSKYPLLTAVNEALGRLS